MHTERELEGQRDKKRETQAELLRRTAPLSPTALWNDPAVEQYALRKLRAAISKSQPLTRFSPEAKSMIKHADMLLVGMHPALTRSAIGKAFELAETYQTPVIVLLDLYLWRPAEALQHLEAYLSQSGTADRQVSGWIAELKRRVGDVAQTAEVQP